MKVKLVQTSPDGQEEVLKELDVTDTRVLIGRKPKDESKEKREDGVTNLLIDNATVSGKHCELTFDGQKNVTVKDSSRNGTTVLYNGQEKTVKSGEFVCKEGLSNGMQLLIKTKDQTYKVYLGDPKPVEAEIEVQPEKAKEKRAKKEKKPKEDKPPKEPKEKAPRKKDMTVPKEAKKRVKKVTFEDEAGEEASESVHEDNFKEFEGSDNEQSDSSVVKDMIVDDQEKSEPSDRPVEKDKMVDKAADEIDFSPELFLVTSAEQTQLQQLEEEKKVDDQEFARQYPMVVIPKPQLDEDLDLYLQIRHFDLFKAPIWVSDLSDDQMEILERFSPKIQTDLNPEKVKYYICSKPKRTARFLLALAAGIPIVDAKTLNNPSLIIKSKVMEYRYLECEMLNPSVREIAEPYGDDTLEQLIKANYVNYSLAFVTSQMQLHRVLCPLGYLVISDSTLKYDVTNVDELVTLINYGLFLTQLGSRVILALDSSKDEIIGGSSELRKLVHSKHFKSGIVRALEGDTSAERAAEYIKKLREGGVDVQMGQVVAEGRKALELEGLRALDKEDFARSCYLGFWIETSEE